jgi:16S rRNA (uracil1498-N3)-methyltransferase
MSHRCFSAEPIAAESITLDGSEAHHLLHVLRAREGARVVVFDGTDYEFDAEVSACHRSTVDLVIHDRRLASRELPHPLTLGVPLPKGDRQRWIVEKAVELGVSRLVPLRTERSVATSDKGGEKLDRYVIEASKQCERNRLMEVAPPMAWSDWLATAPTGARRWVADPSGCALPRLDRALASPTFAAVGPEGGFTEGEIAAAREAGWEIVALGPRILRIETAAVALAAVLTVGDYFAAPSSGAPAAGG